METTFMFYGKPIRISNQDGQFYVSVRHVCEGIGISGYQDQYKKLKANADVFSCEAILTTGPDGKNYEMFGIPLSRLNLWLGGISPSKVKPEIRSELIKYQCECGDALYSHFMKKDSAQDIAGIVAQVVAEMGCMETRIKADIELKFKAMSDALTFTFGNETPVIMSLIEDVAKLEGIDGREVWGDVQVALDVQSYKKMNRRIVNYLKNRKDGSGLRLIPSQEM